MKQEGKVVQYRFFEDNPHVVKECQGWQPWQDIETEAKLMEIREYISWGKHYQIRVLTQTHTEGLELVYIAMSPIMTGPVREEQIVPSLDAIRNYLVRHDIISGSSNELGFAISPGEVHGRFWARGSFVYVRGRPIVQLGVPFDTLKPLLQLYTTSKWKDQLSVVLVVPPKAN